MSSYLSRPLPDHLDLGYGAVAEAFKLAADHLTRVRRKSPSPHAHLPINFLYRHASELYLKSMIVLIHRSRRLQYGPHPHAGQPYVFVGAKWVPLHKIHSVSNLQAYFAKLLMRSRKANKILMTAERPMLLESLSNWARQVDAVDISSTLFRYPTGHRRLDMRKSSWRRTGIDAFFRDTIARGHRAVLAEVTPRGMYRYVNRPMKRLSTDTRKAAHALESVYATIRWKVAGGR